MAYLLRWSIVTLIAGIMLYVILFLTGCGKHGEEETQQQESLQEQLEVTKFYCANMNDATITKRCDRGTFANLANAFCLGSLPYDLSRHEWEPGEHHRDIKPNKCYPDFSQSECSADYFLTKVHDWISRKDPSALAEIERLWSYLDDNDWRCGEGSSSLTDISHLIPLFSSVKAYIMGGIGINVSSNKQLNTPETASEHGSGLTLIPTHDKYLIASYIHAKGRMEGFIGDVEKEALRELMSADPGSPIFLVLYYRFHNGDQQKALDAMGVFSKDTVCMSDEFRGWGSASCAAIQVWATGILRGA